MSDSRNKYAGLDNLLTPDNCVLILIDHQPYQIVGIQSHDRNLVINGVVALAKTAKLFDVPTILTTVVEERSGNLLKEIQTVFPDQKPIQRTTVNTWEHREVVEAVEATGRKKLVFAALWTEICLAFPVLTALGEGYDVYIVTDASGGVTREAHEMAVRRMIQAGAVPLTWMGFQGELQRDWAREKTVAGLADILLEHGGAVGTTLAYEWQLLGQHPKEQEKSPQGAF